MINNLNQQQQDFFNQYLSTLTPEERSSIPQITAEFFCNDEYHTNECARLINQGIKRASCSLKMAYEIENQPLPQVGRITVVLNWAKEPVCIIKLIKVSICPFNQVSEEFAKLEGEGDLSYAWWRENHIQFFNQFAQAIGCEFSEQSELVVF